MEETAMQKMIDWAISQKDNEQQCIDWIVIKNKAEELLLIEKEQMHKCASFWRGKENDIEKPIFDKYYKETFKERYTKQDFLDAAKLGEVSMIYAKHIVSLLDEVKIRSND